MACTSGSVRTVADKTVAAKAEIAKLQKMLEGQNEAHKETFFADIESHLAAANLKDAREISYNSDIKTEYTSEFSLDKIASVVTSALKALAAAKDPSVGLPATSPEAIAAYTDVVNTVAEAAKSSSTSAASLSFSMNRLSPGMYAFLYATSVSIEDEDTFGTEAVTSTAIYYRFMQSIDDIKNEAKFGAAIIDARNLLNLKTLQAALTDDLASGKITIEDWGKKDAAYSAAIATVQKRLEDSRFDVSKQFVLGVEQGFEAPISHSLSEGSTANQKVVRAAIQRLSAKGKEYSGIVETSEARLARSYY